MTLALVATDNGDGTVALAVTGAAHPGTVKYTADFSAGVDSWASGTDGSLAAPTQTAPYVAPDGTVSLLWASANPGTTWWEGITAERTRRTVSGLTNGQTYEVAVTVQLTAAPLHTSIDTVKVGITGDLSDYVSVNSTAPTVVTHQWVNVGTSAALEVRRDAQVGSATPSNVVILAVTVTEVPTNFQPLQIQRTDANGSHYVRLFADAAADNSGVFNAVDTELALVPELVTYVVRDGAGLTASDTLVPAYALPILSAVGYLSELLEVQRVDGYTEAREYTQAQVTVHEVIGRGEPLTASRDDFAWSQRQGTLTFPAVDYPTSQAIAEVHRTGRVTMLRQVTHHGLDLYYVGTRVAVSAGYLTAQGWRWTVQVDYLECGWPDGDMAGSTDWTYGELATAYLAYWNVAGDFATYADLLAGP